MVGDSAKRLLDRLKDSGFLSGGQLEILDSIAESYDDTDESLSAQLVEQGLLTPYQAERLHSDDPSSLLISGRYEIREKIGAGGMGEVYLARDRQLHRDVALKVLPGHLVRDAGAVARFEREAKAMAQLAHPNVVQAFDSGSEGERHYLVMEFVEGESLSERIRREGKIAPSSSADFGYQAALGLDHAHKKGLVHRDLKPSNLLITNEGHVKVLDLGLARFLQDQIDEETITIAGTALGTPDYMAPEQFADARNADERSDVYALGCTLYHMLTGRVPFPGSSLAEKQRDHEEKSPDPILTPGVPAGLALAVQKMMAKAPSRRFQSARECAEALSPYVDVSSSSIVNITATADWDGSQLTILTSPRRKAVARKWGSVAALMILLVAAVGFGISQFGEKDADPKDGKPNEIAKDGEAKKSSPKEQDPSKAKIEPKSEKPDPWVLTVAQDGTGQFKTINAALSKVKPGMTVRVLDDAVYRERIHLNRASAFAGTTLESPNGATLETEDSNFAVMEVTNVPDVTVRGFQFVARSPRALCLFIMLSGDCRGCLLRDLRMRNEGNGIYNGIEIRGGLAESETAGGSNQSRTPIVVQNCRMERPNVGIGIGGVFTEIDMRDATKSRYGDPAYLPAIAIRDNLIVDAYQGVVAKGLLRDVHVVGNRIWGANQGGLQLEHLLEGTANVLFANNTVHESVIGFRLYDTEVKDFDVRFANNLMLRLETDMVVLDSGGNPMLPKGGGDGAAVLKAKRWVFQSNWREFATPTDPMIKQAWIPPGPDDVLMDKIEGVERSSESPDFLKPDADSKLATEGAGRTDPALPSYVGAIPPDGVFEWDWERTWKMPPGRNKVLTVSKSKEDGAMYDSINAALDDAQPWDAIRVLDDDVYRETLLLNDAQQHQGITLESAKRATIEVDQGAAIEITGSVSHLTLKGFRLRTQSKVAYDVLLLLKTDVPGLLIEDIQFESQHAAQATGVAILGDSLVFRDSRAMVIRECSFKKFQAAIVLQGFNRSGSLSLPVENTAIVENQLADCLFAIIVKGAAQNVLVSGNQIINASSVGIQLEHLLNPTKSVLVANNSLIRCGISFRVWEMNERISDRTQAANDVRVVGNLILTPLGLDMIFLDSGGNQVEFQGPGDVDSLLTAWRFAHNWRETLPNNINDAGKQPWIRPSESAGDVMAETIKVLSRDADDGEFLKPDSASALGTGGAGGDLPQYAGAVPPEGIEPWDWNITWRSRQMRERYSK